MVYWKDMLTKKQGDAPMRDFDTTIEAKAYIRGCIDIIVTYSKGSDEQKLIPEFKIEKLNSQGRSFLKTKVDSCQPEKRIFVINQKGDTNDV